MGKDMFVRPLDFETVKEIATDFKIFENVGNITFHRLPKGGGAMGCFSAKVSDDNAFASMLLYSNFCVIQEPGVQLSLVSKKSREYIVCVVGAPFDAETISIHECNSATGMATHLSSFVLTHKDAFTTFTDCNFLIFVPRKDNNRKNIIGTALTRIGNHLRFEFKRDGKSMPILN